MVYARVHARTLPNCPMTPVPSDRLQRTLHAAAEGDPRAASELLPLVYEDLRSLARARMAGLPPGNTLQPTALVHEAYLRLVDAEEARHWHSLGHFFAACAEAMRRGLKLFARKFRSTK